MNLEIVEKYNQAAPRYTSYPPATFFHNDFNNNDYIRNIKSSNNDGYNNISFYVHIPFCLKLCHFCGCNSRIMPSEKTVSNYVDALIKEIEIVASYIDKSRKLSQIHWGGGTPNAISINYIERIMNALRKNFQYADVTEIAMECNPAHLTYADIDRLHEIGFNRLSLGVQDFDENILKYVNRDASQYPVSELVTYIKSKGFKGVNIDLIYGLPKQTVNSFAKSIEQIIEISPDRLVTFSYAHVPWVKKSQTKLETYGLPTPKEKLEMFGVAMQMLHEESYVSIGMDHYAKPDDELYIALKNRQLHRNFQGYATRQTTGQVYGFGTSAISQLEGSYIQNTKIIKDYISSLNEGKLPVVRGYELSKQDKIIRNIISEIMCNGYMDFHEIASKYSLTTDEIIKISNFDEIKLTPFIKDNLLEYNNGVLKLRKNGFLVVRNIAVLFDPLLKIKKSQYSKTI